MNARDGGHDGFHLYCIVPPGHVPEPGLRGVGEEDVRAVDAGEVFVWVSPLGPSPSTGGGPPGIGDVRAHDRVIRAAVTPTVTPLPVRFGQWVKGPDELRERVEGAAPSYGEVLEKLAGAMEMGLRIRIPETRSKRGARSIPTSAPATESTGSGRDDFGEGRAHMERLARRRRSARELESKADELAATLRERLRDLVRADHVPDPDVPRETALICHLVEQTETDAYRREIERFSGEAPELEVTVTGPWPPYSFTG